MRTDRTRVAYRSGQCLAGADLAAQSSAEAELLAVHQARVHNAWGIVSGFECSRVDDQLVLRPGLGLDVQGRMILLARDRQLTVPRGGDALLVASYAEQVPSDQRRHGALPLEEPVLSWRRPTERLRAGTELPIVLLQRTGETETLNLGVRKVAHALVRPKVATGRVQRSSAQVQGTYGNWTMWVPTAAGGLSSPSPAYFVSLNQHPWGELADFGTTEPPPLTQRLSEWVGPFVAVEALGSAGFSLRVSGRLGTWRQGRYPDVSTNPVGLSWIGIDTTFQLFNFWRFLDVRGPLLSFGGVQ